MFIDLEAKNKFTFSIVQNVRQNICQKSYSVTISMEF